MADDSSLDEANTPLDDDEREGLIPTHISAKADLNQWEALNIANAEDWAARRRTLNVLSTIFLKDLHRRMFGATWSWAGQFRLSDKNISPYPWANIPVLMHNLTENTRARYETSDKSPDALDDIAIRFHHELVRIHPWPNGNGRHARLATDLLLRQWGRPPFTWGHGADLAEAGGARTRYIHALRQADAGDFSELRAFVRQT